MEKTSTGLSENVAGLLCYVLGWLSGIVFLLIEQKNRFVRFHAMQSVIVFGALAVINWILSLIPGAGIVLNVIIALLAFVVWIVLMVKAYQGVKYKLPWSGDLAERWMGGANNSQ